MKKIIMSLIIIVIVATTFSGCIKTPTTCAAIGIANTINNSSIDVSGALESSIDRVLSGNGSTLSVFEIDGECYKVGDIISKYNFGQSKTNISSKKNTYIHQVKNYIKGAVPKTAEIDMIYALTAMINDINSQTYGTDNQKSIIIVSNLLSTKGLIDFVKNTIYFDIDTYANFLKSEMTDMSGISVMWIVTETTDMQEKLQQSDKEHLKDFYKMLIENAGGYVEFIDENASKHESDRLDWPLVSTVDIRKKEFKKNQDIDITLDESTLFKADSTEWIDEKDIEKTLSLLVDNINHSKYKTIIAGSTATTASPEDKHIMFSKRRADKVKDKLISLGADINKLDSIGIGKSYEQHRVPDTGKFGSEANKAKNRCVFIVSENTDKAQYFKSVAERFEINQS